MGLLLEGPRRAPVSIVQPVLGVGLVLLALSSVFSLKEEVRRPEWIGIAFMVSDDRRILVREHPASLRIW